MFTALRGNLGCLGTAGFLELLEARDFDADDVSFRELEPVPFGFFCRRLITWSDDSWMQVDCSPCEASVPRCFLRFSLSPRLALTSPRLSWASCETTAVVDCGVTLLRLRLLKHSLG